MEACNSADEIDNKTGRKPRVAILNKNDFDH